jgi:hypothetical protein
MTGHTPWREIKYKSLDWVEYLNRRMRKEDEAVAARFAAYKHLGRGHLYGNLIKGWRSED